GSGTGSRRMDREPARHVIRLAALDRATLVGGSGTSDAASNRSSPYGRGSAMGIRQLRDDDGEHAALHDLGGDGPALLLTHGNGLNAGMWETVVPHLRSTFHCFGLDFRGHG